MNKNHITAWSVLFLMFLGFVQGATATATGGSADMQGISDRISCVLCKVAQLIFLITGAIAALVIIIAGLRWLTSAEDPGARNAAKTTIVSAVIGMIIIMIAVFIVAMIVNGILPGFQVQPQQWMSPGGCAAGPCGRVGWT